MTPEDRDKVTAALRSGTYKQGKGLMHNSVENTYCCLGVIRDVLLKPLDRACFDPHALAAQEAQYLGISSAGQFVSGESVTRGCVDLITLIDVNDRGVPFAEIANLMEAGKIEGIPKKE